MQNSSNDQIIRAVFSATDEAKASALAILEGRKPPTQSSAEGCDSGPLLLSMGEAAGLLGVSRATLWRMIRAGRLTKVEIYSGAFRLRKADLLCLVRGKGAGGETE